MKLSSLAIALFFASSTSTAIAEEVAFSYDPDSATGPAYWGDLNLEDNQCDGESNSPIDVQTFDCDVFASYMLRVSNISRHHT